MIIPIKNDANQSWPRCLASCDEQAILHREVICGERPRPLRGASAMCFLWLEDVGYYRYIRWFLELS